MMQIKYLSLLLNIPLLLIGFFLLNRGAGMLVDGAASVARRLNFPETMIGFTVVAFGASLPKIVTVLLAAYNGYFDLVMGKIVGSCIINFLGILSIIGMYRPIRANKNTATIGILSVVASAFLWYVVANNSMFESAGTTLQISRYEGAIFIAAFILFMTYAYFNVKKHHIIWFNEEEVEKPGFYVLWFAVVLLFAGVIGLIAGGVLVIDNLIDISRKFGLSQRFLGQFVLSFGGSFVMLYWFMITKINQTKYEVSNLVGQNILNILGMLGVAAFLQPLNYNREFNTDIFILIAVSLLIMGLLWMGRKLTLNLQKCRFLLILLLVYVAYLFLR